MSWMTPLRPPATAPLSVDTGCLLLVVEEFFHPAPALLQPVQRQAKVRDRVADRVIGGVSLDLDEERPLVLLRPQSPRGQFRLEFPGALVDLDHQHLAYLGEAGHRGGA